MSRYPTWSRCTIWSTGSSWCSTTRTWHEEDLAALRGLADDLGSHVIIAPRAGMPAPVVATAWTVMLRLDGADTAAIARFWEDHAQRGPEQRACPVE